jgi:hypothetical protein
MDVHGASLWLSSYHTASAYGEGAAVRDELRERLVDAAAFGGDLALRTGRVTDFPYLTAARTVYRVGEAIHDVVRDRRSTTPSASTPPGPRILPVDVPQYEQGHDSGDWMGVAAVVENPSTAAIVHDVSENRWEAWHGGRMINGACLDYSEARRALSNEVTRLRHAY